MKPNHVDKACPNAPHSMRIDLRAQRAIGNVITDFVLLTARDCAWLKLYHSNPGVLNDSLYDGVKRLVRQSK